MLARSDQNANDTDAALGGTLDVSTTDLYAYKSVFPRTPWSTAAQLLERPSVDWERVGGAVLLPSRRLRNVTALVHPDL